jgi:hypothetical protein
MINIIPSKKTITSRIKCISIIILLLSLLMLNINLLSADENNEWTATLNITTDNELSDTIIFGEKSNASNNKDSFDMPKPPAPQPPYIRAWFNTDLTSPYNLLWEEYKTDSSETNTWHFTIDYEDTTESESTTTITWDKSILKTTDYTHINLTYNNEVVATMLTEDSYSYTQQVGNSYDFQITCQTAELLPNEKEENNETNPFFIIAPLLIIIMIGIIVIYWMKNKK